MGESVQLKDSFTYHTSTSIQARSRKNLKAVPKSEIVALEEIEATIKLILGMSLYYRNCSWLKKAMSDLQRLLRSEFEYDKEAMRFCLLPSAFNLYRTVSSVFTLHRENIRAHLFYE